MDFGINAKDILGIKVRFIVPTVSDIPSRGNVGDLCFITDSNIIYIAGMTGWFGYGFDNYIEFPTEESGTVLFDGVVELSGSGDQLSGAITLSEPLEIGEYYSLSLNGTELASAAYYQDGTVVFAKADVFSEEGDAIMLMDSGGGSATVMCSSTTGSVGENTFVVSKVNAPEVAGTVLFDGAIEFTENDGYVFAELSQIDRQSLVLHDYYVITLNGKTFAGECIPFGTTKYVRVSVAVNADDSIVFGDSTSGVGISAVSPYGVVGSNTLKIVHVPYAGGRPGGSN